MAKKTTITKEPKVSFIKKIKNFFTDDRTRYALASIIGVCTLIILFSVFSFFYTGKSDYSMLENVGVIEEIGESPRYENWGGEKGVILANFLVNKSFGIPSVIIIYALIVLTAKLFVPKKVRLGRHLILSLLAMIWLSILFGTIAILTYKYNWFIRLGGNFGEQMALYIRTNIGWIGLIASLFVSAIIYGIFAHEKTLPFLEKLFTKLFSHNNDKNVIDEGSENEENSLTENAINDHNDSEEVNNVIDFVEDEDDLEKVKVESVNNQTSDFVVDFGAPEPKKNTESIVVDENKNDEKVSNGVTFEIEKPTEKQEEKLVNENTSTASKLVEELGKYDPTLDLEYYKFPTLDLLKTYPDENTPVIDMEEQQANKDRIVTTLRNYGIEVDSIKATVGPTVTLYEIVPRAGTRISKIKGLEDDITLGLAVDSTRIIAPIPGKGTVGIEIPNKKKQVVSMHSLIASKKFQEESKMQLPIVLGKTITNEVFMFDLAKTPHLLVAGATGQGKSVGLNAIIASLLYKKHPSQLKMVLVDPKMVEFSIYAPLEKYFMAKVPDADRVIITDSTKVIQTLNSLVIEMENRYTLLMEAGCRKLEEYNEKFVNRQLNPEKGHRFLPFIVIVIDEYGDLIMAAGKEIETPIARICQKARAVGMHMILATQRPSVNVITGLIKANVPTRISFKVMSAIDSRTVLDATGANQLIGRGDLLYTTGAETTRVQCGFIDTPEVNDLVNYINEQQSYSSAYILPECEIKASSEVGGGGEVKSSERDPMLMEAARLIVENNTGSTSFIQRKMSIGYNRAGRIIDQLEALGVVGPFDGSKARQVLVHDLFELEQKLSQ